ncbi:MAG: fumarylacetoacetate hydrolase family protein [Bacteroidetes bacterium]|nr:fumarylacetoacetate hydrolase family protein [Rhodothermia bacterium]MCS7155395.1 fumarylacetoacetate hydrolase family protein [Bacteroidota bacterium]MCX7907512.1 fumarylacetoacetate hydrolase family protein [Bacteroidota bacterium]MDW8138506.1 fumarylacetoacetate hydrolase family protein [Bacteroidota bacterium]MDW8284557.1 fumarylacetoacetate hydrolase family protein [Bacteroidota bacterium]
MRLVSFLHPRYGEQAGLWVSEEHVLSLCVPAWAAYRNGQISRSRWHAQLRRNRMSCWLQDADRLLEAAHQSLALWGVDPELVAPFLFPMSAIRMLAPVPRPSAFRDFYAFPEHVRRSRARRGLEVPPEWYEMPVFYFSNPETIKGPDEPIRRPPYTRALDYELELGAVLGWPVEDASPEEAEQAILGFVILNDWSARDLQRREMAVGLGPAKSKDFATSIGPCLLTADEVRDRRLDGGRYELTMRAYVNGRLMSQGNARDMHYGFGALLAWASQAVRLSPGTLIGSGTVGSGCLLELGAPEAVPWLEPGDEVVLEIERIGRLRNRIVDSTTPV